MRTEAWILVAVGPGMKAWSDGQPMAAGEHHPEIAPIPGLANGTLPHTTL
jgi:hypothetical protein